MFYCSVLVRYGGCRGVVSGGRYIFFTHAPSNTSIERPASRVVIRLMFLRIFLRNFHTQYALPRNCEQTKTIVCMFGDITRLDRDSYGPQEKRDNIRSLFFYDSICSVVIRLKKKTTIET